MNKIQRLIERGEGYWCFKKECPREHPPPIESHDSDIGISDYEPIQTVGVYRPVSVEVNDDGEPYAYYYDSDASIEQILEYGGKVIVPIEQVYVTPLSGFETPAYKVGDS